MNKESLSRMLGWFRGEVFFYKKPNSDDGGGGGGKKLEGLQAFLFFVIYL